MIFDEWLIEYAKRNPRPEPWSAYRIENWVLWVAVAVLGAATIASGAHNIPTIQSTLPSEWPAELRWFVSFAGFIAFDIGLFLAAYLLFFFKYRSAAQIKLGEFKKQLEIDPDLAVIENPAGNPVVLMIGAVLTILYTVIANVSAAGTELLAEMPQELKVVVVLGMGIIPLWAFVAGENVARIRAFNSVAGEIEQAENDRRYRKWLRQAAGVYERQMKKISAKQAPLSKQGTEQATLSEQEVNKNVAVSGELTANLNSHERGQLFRRAWEENPAQFNGMTYRQIAEKFGISSAAVSNIRNGK